MKALSEAELTSEAVLAEDTDQIANRTAHFVGQWIEEHVIEKATTFSAGDDTVEELAKECIADAKREAIPAEDIQGEIGDLKEYIAEAIDQ